MLSDLEEIFVTGHEDIGLSGHSLFKNRDVVGVPELDAQGRGTFDDFSLAAQEFVRLFGEVGCYPKLPKKHGSELRQDRLANEEPVLREGSSEDVGADSSGGNGRGQDVCVEEDPHDTSRKTSSSVRYPWASAKGMIPRRSSSNWESANCRRSASRTNSLRVRPLCFAARSRRRSRSGSSLTVRAEVFMSCNVIRQGRSNKGLNLTRRDRQVWPRRA